MKMRVQNIGVLFGCAIGAAAMADDVRLSQTVSDEVIPGFGRLCPALGPAGAVEASSYWRSFDLRDQGVDRDLSITGVQFGIESLRLPTLGEVDIMVNLYQAAEGTPPQTGLPLIGSTIATVGEASGEVVSVDIDALAAVGSALVVEISVPSLRDLAGGEFGDSFVPGANGFGESAPVYFASDACDIGEPQPWNPDWGTFHFVLSVSGTAFCATDLDGDGLLTVFDFLEFSNLFDMGDLRADFDGDGVLTVFDFLEFQNRFGTGC